MGLRGRGPRGCSLKHVGPDSGRHASLQRCASLGCDVDGFCPGSNDRVERHGVGAIGRCVPVLPTNQG